MKITPSVFMLSISVDFVYVSKLQEIKFILVTFLFSEINCVIICKRTHIIALFVVFSLTLRIVDIVL